MLTGKMKQVSDGRLQGCEASEDFVVDFQAILVGVNAAAKEAQIELDGDKTVPHFMGDMGRHLAEISQAIDAIDAVLAEQMAQAGA